MITIRLLEKGLTYPRQYSSDHCTIVRSFKDFTRRFVWTCKWKRKPEADKDPSPLLACVLPPTRPFPCPTLRALPLALPHRVFSKSEPDELEEELVPLVPHQVVVLDQHGNKFQDGVAHLRSHRQGKVARQTGDHTRPLRSRGVTSSDQLWDLLKDHKPNVCLQGAADDRPDSCGLGPRAPVWLDSQPYWEVEAQGMALGYPKRENWQ